MPFLGPNMTSTMQGIFLSKGVVGTDSIKFSTAVSNGSQAAVVGKSFSTVDTGTTPGAGPSTGTGVGVTIASGLIKSAIMAKGLSGGLAGVDFEKVADVAATAFAAEMALVSLSSTHAPVFAGSGQIQPGSITVDGAEMGDNIFKAGAGAGLAGADFSNLAKAVGFGFGEGVKVGIGIVTIVGVPVPPPVVPVPGPGSSITGVMI